MKRWERITRITALSLIMLFSIAAVLPLISSSAHSNRPAAASSKKKKLRQHSRAWWRRYRERQRRRRHAALVRKKALAGLRQGKAERQSPRDNPAASNPLLAPLSNMIGLGNDSRSQSTPVIATEQSSRPVLSGSEKGVRLNTPDGQTVGQVSVAVVANAVGGGGAASPSARRRALSGVPFAALRRMVIDKMLASGGWVVNDFEREINGRRVYVVLAQTSAPNDRRVPQQSWTFYFTEAEGRIYNIVSNAPLEFSDRLAVEAERVIAMLGTSGPQQSNPSASRR
ncbi:MAG: hypothetical protein H0W99_06825 [Acidobacteria bacterium]|nr:hypothetical protein [Acidobacteriota bacterium]